MHHYLSLVKFTHTIFALPFSILGFFLAILIENVNFSWIIFLKIIICMITARNAAMAFNRYLDQDIDKINKRTANREIPAGLINNNSVLIFIFINVFLFILCTYFINQLCFLLSPIAIFIILFYSYTKRFTKWCHFILGLGLALAPIGAYLATANSISLVVILFGFVILFWVAGFDIIYALQDYEFDKKNKLHSTVVSLGPKKASVISKWIHFISIIFLIFASVLSNQQILELYIIHWFGVFIFVSLIIYQHTIFSPTNLSKINLAFFTSNGFASIAYVGCFILDIYWN